ncbi:ABC transporter permease [Martelella alba]|uniref:ABC transporter permease n=2 Tax=Martelella alba TaxID=2590451 RepID=A0A506UAJ0_9HYPH|nr:ABC transporter permease [Martelella sp. HB161492]TPW31432.1 ABC transporter permease [Martelella alba]
MRERFLPIATVVVVILALWCVFVVVMNRQFVEDQARRSNQTLTFSELVEQTYHSKRPVLPAPQQVATEMWKTVFQTKITSKRSLVYHAWVTLSSTLVGFAIGASFGVLLAIAIVHNRTMDRSMMPWIIASQTIPIIAVAPMLIVVLNAINITGLLPKALISTYLSFFPVAVGMVQGLRSPDQLQMDLMHTYNANQRQILWKLRLPAAMPYLFTSLKIAVAISLVGAIIAELPTGAVAGLGARLLSGSYYGQTVQIWAALFMAAILASVLVAAISVTQTIVLKRMGARP